MANTNLLKTVAPGLWCAHPKNIMVQEHDEVLNIIISPEKNSFTELYFAFPKEMREKKYFIQINFHDEHASIHLMGLYHLSHMQCADIKTEMNHFAPHCTSHQRWRGVLQDSAKAAFEGKIIVHPNAQKTDAQLSNKNLLLSKDAEINAKPFLEIYADDVKCSHGATMGCLDEQALFYLRSRGIAENTARDLLVQAFIDEVSYVV